MDLLSLVVRLLRSLWCPVVFCFFESFESKMCEAKTWKGCPQVLEVC